MGEWYLRHCKRCDHQGVPDDEEPCDTCFQGLPSKYRRTDPKNVRR